MQLIKYLLEKIYLLIRLVLYYIRINNMKFSIFLETRIFKVIIKSKIIA